MNDILTLIEIPDGQMRARPVHFATLSRIMLHCVEYNSKNSCDIVLGEIRQSNQFHHLLQLDIIGFRAKREIERKKK